MKIIFSSNYLRDLFNFRGDVIQYFVDRGIEVVLVAPSCDINILPKYSNKVRIVEVFMEAKGMNPINDIRYMYSLINIYRREKPDYIFHYTIKPNIYGSIVAKMLNIPSTSMIAGLGHVFTSNNLGSILARILYKAAMKFPENIMVLNKDNYKLLVDKGVVCSDKLRLLLGGEGINLNTYTSLPMPRNKKPVFLMISRLLYEKGYSEYVYAARQLKGKAEFRIMGFIDTHPSSVSKETVNHDTSKGLINYLGFSSDVAEQVANADCIVLPSYHEGLSRVLIEALAFGRPIIASDIPGCKETVDEANNGLLVKSKDCQDLTKACSVFLSLTNEEKEAMAIQSRIKAEMQFDVENVIRVYESILKNNKHFVECAR